MIALKNVTAGRALKDVSFAIHPKECVCVEGSESDLTTLFRVLATLESPAAGGVEVDNVDVSVLPRPVLQLFRSRLGLVFHPPLAIGHLTVGQNVSLPLHLRGMKPGVITKAADDLMKRLGLSAKARELPSALNDEERQLMCLARCLIGAPLVVVAHEPFRHLSDQHAYAAATLFQNLRKKGTTLILLSSDERTARLMNARAVTLANGKISGMSHAAPADPKEEEPVLTVTPVAEKEKAPEPVVPPEEEIVVRKKETPMPATQKKAGKIHITPIGSGLS